MTREPVDDLVVVVPGIMGSALAVDERPVWELSGAALLNGLRTLGRCVDRLRLPEDLGDGHPGDGVEATGLMRGVHGASWLGPLSCGYGDLLGFLEANFTLARPDRADPEHVPNLIPFAYDWRLSNRHTAQRLACAVAEAHDAWMRRRGNPDARVVLIAHSMGGLVCRYYLAGLRAEEAMGGRERVRALVTLGTPYRGSADALLTLVNGRARRLERARVNLTALARSMPSLHQLLPAYACVATADGLARVDEVSLAGPDPKLVSDAVAFHRQIADGVAAGDACYQTVPVLGVRQSTVTTARVDGDRLAGVVTINGADEGGDGTVPHLSAYPPELRGSAATFREHPAQHGHLPDNAAARDAIWTVLRGEPPAHRGPEGEVPLDVGVDAEHGPGEPVRVAVTAPEGRDELAVAVRVERADGTKMPTRTARNLGGGRYELAVALDPGVYRVTATAREAAPVTAYTVVWDDDE